MTDGPQLGLMMQRDTPREGGRSEGSGAWTQAAPEAKTAAADDCESKRTAETLSLTGQCNLRVTDVWLTSRVVVSAHMKYDGGRAGTVMCL